MQYLDLFFTRVLNQICPPQDIYNSKKTGLTNYHLHSRAEAMGARYKCYLHLI